MGCKIFKTVVILGTLRQVEHPFGRLAATTSTQVSTVTFTPGTSAPATGNSPALTVRSNSYRRNTDFST